jgi:IclR family pca regulon transcriptional regulator
MRTYCANSAQNWVFMSDNDIFAKRDLVAGLEKGLQVIEAFDQERSRLSIAEVAERRGAT